MAKEVSTLRIRVEAHEATGDAFFIVENEDLSISTEFMFLGEAVPGPSVKPVSLLEYLQTYYGGVA